MLKRYTDQISKLEVREPKMSVQEKQYSTLWVMDTGSFQYHLPQQLSLDKEDISPVHVFYKMAQASLYDIVSDDYNKTKKWYKI